MTKKNEVARTVPELRFPEFRDALGWSDTPLKAISTPVNDRVGEKILTPISISAGIGFVPQSEKFGRDISGNQYALYTHVRRGDFVYNKGNSIKFPQGCVYILDAWSEVAAPNVFICFRLKQNYSAQFYQYCFEKNLHGDQLKRFITSGARSNGLLNINKSDFFDIKLPLPTQQEQQKIADCLSSIDDLINAQAQKIETFKAHKKSLVQQLFPAEGETVPRLRFSEFQGAASWVDSTLGAISKITSGGTPSRSKPNFWNGDIPWITTSLIDSNLIHNANEYITKSGLKESSAKIFPKNTILMAMYGQGKTRGKVAILGIDAATNQACAAIIPNKKINSIFIFQNLTARYDEIRKLSNTGGQENLSAGLIEEIPIRYTNIEEEQQKIADCLSSLDDLITAHNQKLEALKVHKKGLMQGLFQKVEK